MAGLTLSRRWGEWINIGDDIRVMVVSSHGSRAELLITAPVTMPVCLHQPRPADLPVVDGISHVKIAPYVGQIVWIGNEICITTVGICNAVSLNTVAPGYLILRGELTGRQAVPK